MVVCICRNIRDSEYSDQNELIERLLQDDLSCGKCLEEFVDGVEIGALDAGAVPAWSTIKHISESR